MYVLGFVSKLMTLWRLCLKEYSYKITENPNLWTPEPKTSSFVILLDYVLINFDVFRNEKGFPSIRLEKEAIRLFCIIPEVLVDTET